MKASKISLYIFIVIGILALVCIFFPSDGIHLRFPGLTDVMRGDTTQVTDETKLSPDELLDKRISDARLEEESQFIDYFKNNEARFFMPNDDVKYLDEFFAALDAAGETPVRVTHYGDSQIEIDRISCILRERLQEKFGGGGVGYIPLRKLGTYTYKVDVNPDLTIHYAFGGKQRSDDKYGMAASSAELSGGSVRIHAQTTPDTNYVHSHEFTRVTLMAGNNSAPITVTCGEQTKTIAPTATVGRVAFSIPSNKEVDITVSGAGSLYGALLDGAKGVSVDNIPMRGCSGTVFNKINADNLREHYTSLNVGLIIMQYGGNTMPYIKEGQPLDNYVASLGRQIAYLHQIAPKAKILFIGPSDMSTRIQGTMQSYPVLPKVVEGIKKVANENGAAFWDMYGVMGGHNSMIKWVQSGLAGSDHVHFTKKGAERVGDVLCKSMMLYYDYYKWRTSPVDKEKYMKSSAPADSTAIRTENYKNLK